MEKIKLTIERCYGSVNNWKIVMNEYINKNTFTRHTIKYFINKNEAEDYLKKLKERRKILNEVRLLEIKRIEDINNETKINKPNKK